MKLSDKIWNVVLAVITIVSLGACIVAYTIPNTISIFEPYTDFQVMLIRLMVYFSVIWANSIILTIFYSYNLIKYRKNVWQVHSILTTGIVLSIVNIIIIIVTYMPSYRIDDATYVHKQILLSVCTLIAFIILVISYIRDKNDYLYEK